jgi:hypothetical protein
MAKGGPSFHYSSTPRRYIVPRAIIMPLVALPPYPALPLDEGGFGWGELAAPGT